MATHRAYYSIIQYCPDRGRAEAANIGVLLLCPDLGFVQARMSGDTKRVRQFFGPVDNKRLLLLERAIEARVREHYDWSEGIASLERFIGSRANDIQLTPARPMKTSDPAEDIETLFAELVEGAIRGRPVTESKEPPKQLEVFERLDAGLRAPRFMGRIQFDQVITIPVMARSIEVPYAYRNGVVNLVKPVEFRGMEDSVLGSASELAVEGDLLSRHTKGQRLVVLPAFTGRAKASASHVEKLLSEYNVRVVEPEHVDAFLAEVDQTAH